MLLIQLKSALQILTWFQGLVEDGHTLYPREQTADLRLVQISWWMNVIYFKQTYWFYENMYFVDLIL